MWIKDLCSTPCSAHLNKKYLYYCVNKTGVEQGAEQGAEQGVEQGKFPCSAPGWTPCIPKDEKLKVKIKK